MMKFTQAINVAVASVLVVPALTLQSGAADSLHQSLERTLLAIETLSGIGDRIQAAGPEIGPAAAQEVVGKVVAHTEPALAPDLHLEPSDPAARDQLLEALRTDVATLQSKLDSARPAGETADPKLDLPLPGAHTDPVPPQVTTGLDDDMRSMLAAKQRLIPRPVPVQQSATDKLTAKRPTKITFEDDGFTADPLKLAQAYYRAGEYQQAIDVLELQSKGAEALYWQARSLEKLGDHEGATEAYTAVSEMEDAGPLRERALEDIEFLKWRLEFEQQTKGKQPQ